MPNTLKLVATTFGLLGLVGVIVSNAAKAQYYYGYSNGGSTSIYGSDGSSYHGNSYGNNTLYDYNDGRGNSGSGVCSTVGSTVFCY